MNIKKTLLESIIQYHPLAEVTGVSQALENMKIFFKSQDETVPDKIFKVPKLAIPVEAENVLIGIEIELENNIFKPFGKIFGLDKSLIMSQKLISTAWQNKEDSSLKDSGVEWVTLPGLKAKDAPEALAMLNSYLAMFFSKTNLSYRCGTHVHLNVRDFTVEQFINLTMLYILFEDLFYNISGKRYENIFCVPLRSSHSYVEALFTKLIHKEKPTPRDFRSLFTNFKKYMAFNLLPVGRVATGPHGESPLGTVEFRHHEGESNPQKLANWIQHLLAIHTAARQYSFEDLRDLIFKMNTVSNYLNFAEVVFGRIPDVMTPQDVVNDMYEGSSFLKELYLTSKGE